MITLNYKTTLFNKRIEPQFGSKVAYDTDLEGLRGFAAIGVLLAHGLGMTILDSTWLPGGILPYFSVGGLSVYIFFMLSGYVIGLSFLKSQQFSIAGFYKKRLLRLYPIYLFTFLFLIFLGSNNTTWQTIGNLFMLQNMMPYGNLHIPVEGFLEPIWSINYEAFYYLLFPLMLFIRPKAIFLFSILFIISFTGYYSSIIPAFLSDYAVGYLFWMGGLIICWYLPFNTNQNGQFRFMSYLFLMMSYHHLAVGTVILKGLHLYDERDHRLGIETLIYLPICILIIADISKKIIPGRKLLIVVTYTIPLSLIIYLAVTNRLFEDIRWIACTIFYFLSLVLFKEKKISTIILKRLSFIGTISYAIYLIHFPLAILVNKLYPYSGNAISYILKFIIWIILTLFISYLLEKKLQPKIKSYFLNDAKKPVLILQK